MKRIFKISKWLHKYIGLALILFLMWMSLSGVLMNHPDLISGISVPRWLVPSQYHPDNWNRSGILNAVFSKANPGVAYLGGKLGVFKSINGNVLENPIDNCFPSSSFYRKTNHLFLLESDSTAHLLAATDGGLYISKMADEQWQHVRLGDKDERALKILQVKSRLLVFTPSGVYVSESNAQNLNFAAVDLQRSESERHVFFIKLLLLFYYP